MEKTKEKLNAWEPSYALNPGMEGRGGQEETCFKNHDWLRCSMRLEVVFRSLHARGLCRMYATRPGVCHINTTRGLPYQHNQGSAI